MPQQTKTDQWIDVVAKLTALTQDGDLEWLADRYASDEPGVIDPSYRTSYKNRSLRLQKRRVARETFSGTEHVIAHFLDFVDDSDNSLWTFPEVDAIEHLYNAVRYQTAGVKDFVEDLLSDG